MARKWNGALFVLPTKNGEAHGITADSIIFEVKGSSTNDSIAIGKEQGQFLILYANNE